MDAQAFPAAEVATLYHERLELELAYDEIKTEMHEGQGVVVSAVPLPLQVYSVPLAQRRAPGAQDCA